MPKQGKTPKKKSKEKTPQKSGESEYPAMDEDEYTLDMYLPLSKFESIHRVSIALRCNNNLL